MDNGVKFENIEIDYENVACTLGDREMAGISCLEEFIENSISAGANRINIDILWQSPTCTHLIFVIKDDGCGIDLEILKRKVFSIGQSGLKEKNSMSIHGFGGLQSLYVIQRQHPEWRLETKSNESISSNIKYIVNGPVSTNKERGIQKVPLDTDEPKIPGTEIFVKFDKSAFLSCGLTEKNRFDYFIKRLHERLGIKYYQILEDGPLRIEIKWKHNGEVKQERGVVSRITDCTSEVDAQLHPGDEGIEIIKAVDWRKITELSDNLPIPRSIYDPIHKLTHSQECTKLIEHFSSERARNAGIRNYHIFPLKDHFQNRVDPKCFYIYYREMLIDILRLSEVSGEINSKVWDHSKFVCVITLDPNTDPKVTNVIKDRGKQTHHQYSFLLKELSSHIKGDLSRIFPDGNVRERDLKKQMVDSYNNTYETSGISHIQKAELEVGLRFGYVDIVITNEQNKTKQIMEVKKGNVGSNDFLQIKDYKDQIELMDYFPGYTLSYYLVGSSFAEVVKERCRTFSPKFQLNLMKLNTIDDKYLNLKPISI